MSNVSYKSCTLLWYSKKEKCFHKISIFTFIKIFFPGLPNLRAQLRCAQNRYVAVQMDLKYPLLIPRNVYYVTFGPFEISIKNIHICTLLRLNQFLISNLFSFIVYLKAYDTHILNFFRWLIYPTFNFNWLKPMFPSYSL